MVHSTLRNTLGFNAFTLIRRRYIVVAFMLLRIAASSTAEVPLEGFIPLVGMGLTDQFASSDGANSFFFVSDPARQHQRSVIGKRQPSL